MSPLRTSARRRATTALLAALGALVAAPAGADGAPFGTAGAGSGRPAANDADAPPAAVLPLDGAGVVQKVREPGARAVLLNVWATWCQPCLEEMPDVLHVARERERDGLRLLLVSGDFADQREAAARFLARFGVTFETYIKQGDDMAFIDAVHEEWSGALPATFVYDGDGRLLQFHEGKVSRERLESWIDDALGRGATGAQGEQTR